MPSHPIVLAHGYLGFGALGPIQYFNNVAALFKQLGAREVYATDVAPKESIQKRAEQLAHQIRSLVPEGKVHLIAHSMGGLDARYLIGRGEGQSLIASLTTLGAPFRGSVAADIAVNPLQLGTQRLSVLTAITRYQQRALQLWPFHFLANTTAAFTNLRDVVSRLTTGNYSHVKSYFSSLFSLNDAALSELTTTKCSQLFPEDEQDLQDIPAVSYAGSLEPTQVSPFLSLPAILLDSMGEPNDGVVSVESAKLKNHKATLAVDHLGLIGWGTTDVLDWYRQIYQALSL